MLIEELLAADPSLRVDEIKLECGQLIVELAATTADATCPRCGIKSQRCHSHYHRKPADLPVIGYGSQLRIRVRRFFCDSDQCPKRTFVEQFPALLAFRARRTERLTTLIEQIAFEVSAESGARLLSWCGTLVSSDTLLRLVRKSSDTEPETPSVLGVDGWAKKRGQSYGTILVDIEKHQIIDLLEDCTGASLAKWLQEHPGVEIICRDRGAEYIKGASVGAPNAMQVADRWHLLVNMHDAIERLVRKKPACLKAAGEQPEVQIPEAESTPPDMTEESTDNNRPPKANGTAKNRAQTKPEKRKRTRRKRKQERFDLVRSMHQEGFSAREIARQLQMSTNTVRKYLTAESCPFYPEGIVRGPSKLDPYVDYLTKRWQEGCHNGTQLWREIRTQGFNGCRPLVSRWATEQRRWLPLPGYQDQQDSTLPPVKRRTVPWSARRTAWLLVKSEEDMDEEEHQALVRVKETDSSVAQAHQLAQAFRKMVRQREPEELTSWLHDVSRCSIDPLVSFAHGIRKDVDAVRNALSMEWSNGQTEGHVNRLKSIKRQMYGRANFDLLRKRVLGPTAAISR